MTTIAFFDLDYTLLTTSSGLLYVREVVRQGRVPWWYVGQIGLRYQLKQLDFGQAHARLITRVARAGRVEALRFFEEWVPRRLFPQLAPGARTKVAWHREQGHRVVILSASIEEIVRPIAAHLGLGQDYLCTRLAISNGHYTGRLDGPLCYGPGKVELAGRWLAENGLDFNAAGYFYTDSSSDLPLLEKVANPVAVNPSRKLARLARDRNWPIEYFY